jgi:hypothetical protein
VVIAFGIRPRVAADLMALNLEPSSGGLSRTVSFHRWKIRERAALHLNKALSAVLATVICGVGATVAAAEAPAPGCYERIYDAAHPHARQRVRWHPAFPTPSLGGN